MGKCNIVKFLKLQVLREEPLQMSDMSALPIAVYLLWWYTKQQEHVKALTFRNLASYI